MWQLTILLLVGSAAHYVFGGNSDEIIFTVQENVKLNSKVGDCKQELTEKMGSGRYEEFELLNEGEYKNILFKIVKKTGILYTNALIDREKLCDKKSECSINFLVRYNRYKASSSNAEMHLIKLCIQIEDANDNNPVFQPRKLQITVRETSLNVRPNQLISLPVATDKDTEKFGVKRYKIKSSRDFNRYFQLIQPEKPSLVPHLKLLRSLDREKISKFSFKLIAVDGGNKEGVAEIVIIVQDINDNPPRWRNKEMTAHVRECDQTNTAIATLEATDKDTGKNGMIEFKISQMADNFIHNHFYIQDRTLLIHRELDYEKHHNLRIPIEAVDVGIPSARLTSTAYVNVIIEDCNDNPPVIKIMKEARTPSIKENSKEVHRLATVIARDADSGLNGVVDCFLNDGLDVKLKMPLKYPNPKTYNIENRLEYPFDREKNPRVNVRITCRDQGKEAVKTTVQEFYVTIEDENDNHPTFPSTPFKFKVVENRPPNTYVGTVKAHDKDEGENARLSYNISKSGAKYFMINKNGELFTKIKFDREQKSLYTFTVTATDHGKVRLNSSTIVNVYIDDQNDCAPKFKKSIYEFNLKESEGKRKYYKSIGRVEAVDDDRGENGTVTYSLQRVPKNIDAIFLISPSGQLSVNGVVDREKNTDFNLDVVASDNGRPRRSATINVRVEVKDVNDNAPVFEVPKTSGTVVNITLPATIGDTIYTVMATDADNAETHEQISYFIQRQTAEQKPYFKIDRTTGMIVLLRNIEKNSYRGPWRLTLKAADDGGKKFTLTTLLIRVVNNRNPRDRQHITERGIPVDDSSNMTILYALAAVVFAVFIILFVVLVLFYLRCCDCNKGPRKDGRDTESHHYDAVSMPVQENQYQERQGKETLPLDASLLPRDTGCQKLADEYQTEDNGYTNLHTGQRVRSTSYGYIPVNLTDEAIYGARTLRRGPPQRIVDQETVAVTPGSYEAFNLVGGGADTTARDTSETLKRHGPNISVDTSGTGKIGSTHSYTRLESPSKTVNRNDKGSIEPSPFSSLKSPYITTSFV